jgi:hypothetical protein
MLLKEERNWGKEEVSFHYLDGGVNQISQLPRKLWC